MPPHSVRTAATGLLLATVGCFGSPSDGPLDGGSTSTSGAATSSSTVTGAASATSSSTSDATDSVTSSGTESGTLDSSDTGSSDTGGDPSVVFFDDFEREDSLSLGNGWLEKTADAWQLLDGRVKFEANAAGFAQSYIMQPAIDMRDVEASVEFGLADVRIVEFPQVHARIDVEATMVTDEARSYGVFVELPTAELRVSRRIRGQSTPFPGEPFTTPLVAGERYRVTIRISGTDPVAIEGELERDVGGTWQTHTSVLTLDTTPERITSGGAVGTSGNLNIAALTYDNFLVRDFTRP